MAAEGSKNVTLGGRNMSLEDADTWVDKETGKVYRGKGYDAEEVWHAGTKEDPMKSPATNQGYMQTEIVADMMNNKGYDDLEEAGTGYYGRTLGVAHNEDEGESLARKLHSEGLTKVNRYTSEDDYMATIAGELSREMYGETDNYWAHARDSLDASSMLDKTYFKQVALDEEEFAKAPWMYRGADFRSDDRTLDNQATNAFGTGWDAGWNSIYGSIQGFKAAFGDAIGNEQMYHNGVMGVEEYEYKNSKLPTYASDIGSIEGVRDAGRYMAGMMGQALPYILGIAGSAGVGAFVGGSTAALGMAVGALPPAMVYAGEVYGSMEGNMDERNSAAAMAAGVVMGVLDRVGLHGLLNTKSLLKDDAMEKIAIELQKKKGLSAAQAKAEIKKATFSVQEEVSNAVGEVVTIQMSKSLVAKEFGQSFGKGALSEGVTEGLQETTSYAASVGGSEKEWKSEDYSRILMNAVAGGALLGGTLGGTMTTAGGYGNFKSQQRKFSQAAADVQNSFYEEYNTIGGLEDLYNMNDMANHGKDATSDEEIIQQADAESEKGRKEDSVKAKGWWQTLKELPGKATQKGGSRLLEKFMESDSVSADAKLKLAILMDNFAPSNKSHMAGMPVHKYKTMVMHKLLNHADMNKSEFIRIFNTKKSGKAYDAKMRDFEAWQMETDEGQLDGPMHKKYSYIDSELNVLHKRIVGNTNTLWAVHKGLVDDSRDAMVGYFYKSAVLNPASVRKNKELFVQALVDGWHSPPGKDGAPGAFHQLSTNEAHQLWDDVVNGPEGYEHDSLSDLGFKNRKAGTLRKTKLTLRDSQVMKDTFLERDNFEKLKFNITSTINHDVDLRTLGKNGANFDRAIIDLKEEMGDQWDSRIATMLRDSVAATRGDYKPLQNKFLAAVQGHLTFIGTITQLDTSMLASLPEIGLLLLNAPKNGGVVGIIKNASRDLKKHYKRSLIETAQNVKSGLGISMEEYTQNQLDFYNFGYDSAKHGVMGHMDIGQEMDHMSKFKTNMLQTFFTMNLLKPFTDGSRVAKLSMAQDAIVQDLEIVVQYLDGGSNYAADAYERLRDLNVNPTKLAAEYKSIANFIKENSEDHSAEAIYELIANDKSGQMEALTEQFQIARNSYVDNVLANPNAFDRPLWYSNPHFRLMTQYKGFLSTFTAHILPRIYRQVKHGNPEARYQAVAAAATMIMFGFLGQDLKDEWKYADGHNPWLKEHGKLQRGVMASGLLGTPGELINMLHPYYDFKVDAAGLMTDIAGPFTGTLANGYKIAQKLLEGNSSAAQYYAQKMVPLVGRHHLFNERPNSNF